MLTDGVGEMRYDEIWWCDIIRSYNTDIHLTDHSQQTDRYPGLTKLQSEQSLSGSHCQIATKRLRNNTAVRSIVISYFLWSLCWSLPDFILKSVLVLVLVPRLTFKRGVKCCYLAGDGKEELCVSQSHLIVKIGVSPPPIITTTRSSLFRSNPNLIITCPVIIFVFVSRWRLIIISFILIFNFWLRLSGWSVTVQVSADSWRTDLLIFITSYSICCSYINIIIYNQTIHLTAVTVEE